jgi:hypothetical protein
MPQSSAGQLKVSNQDLAAATRQGLESALDALFASDTTLLTVDASERSITHRLAVHLAAAFPRYDVDCEYNRDGVNIKRLTLGRGLPHQMKPEAVAVVPDVIVHKRGHNADNLLVVEVKKLLSRETSDYDLQKLQGYVAELDYRFGAHITLGFDLEGAPTREVVWLERLLSERLRS